MRLSNIIRLAILLVCARGISAQSCTTNFPLTQNPIATESCGTWVSGQSAGGNLWADVRTNGVMAFGPQGTQIPTPFGDATAVLTGSWLPNQIASATIKIPGTAPASCCHEVELRLNTTISASSITGYEILFQVATGQTYGIQVARWNGANGQFVELGNSTAIPRGVNGDTFKVASSGTNPRTLKVYVNGASTPALTVCDNGGAAGTTLCGFTYSTTGAAGNLGAAAGPFSNGSPGIGFFDDNGTGADWNTFGLSSFTASSSCPSAANYTSLTNFVGAGVTLASLGVNSCFYVAANGADTNDGLTEATPWLHAPKMPNCASNCASATLGPGVGIILRGGDTWHFGITTDSANNPASGGMWNFNVSGVNGTSANPIYIGNDPAWFSGGSWVRPKMNADNPLTPNPNVVGDSVVSCAHQIGAQNEFLIADVRKFYIFDNFDWFGMCQQVVGQPGHNDVFFSYAAPIDHLYFFNNYVHGVTHLPFAFFNGSASCSTAVCFNISVFQGGSSAGPDIIAKNVIDFTDSDPAAAGLCKGGFNTVAYNVFKATSQCITVGAHSFHDNLYTGFIENGHSNVYESNNNADQVGVNVIYNNVFSHLDDVNGQFAGHLNGSVGLWPSPPVGSTDYVFNNILWGMGNMQIFNIGLSGSAQGQLQIFNNTFQANVSASGNPSSTAILRCDSVQTHPFTSANNHFIIDTSVYTSPCTGKTEATNLTQTNSVANTAGYTAAQPFAYSPTLLSSPTVAAGTIESSFCTALSTAAGSDASLADAAAACLDDSTYAGIYNATTHTISFPARTVIAHPPSTPWSIGDYELSPAAPVATFCSGTVSLGLAPFGLTGNPVACSLTNTGTANLVNTQIVLTSTSFQITSNTCGSPATITTIIPGTGFTLTPGQACTFNVVFQPQGVGFQSGFVSFTENTPGLVDSLAINGTGTGTPAPAQNMFAGNVILKGSVSLK